MDAAFMHICTNELVVQTIMMIAVSVVLRFVLFGCSGVAAHKGAYGALFQGTLLGSGASGKSSSWYAE